MNRRNFLLGAGVTLVAAPAIVRVASIMPVKALPLADPDALRRLMARKLYEVERAIEADLTSYLWGDPCSEEMTAIGREYGWTPLVTHIY